MTVTLYARRKEWPLERVTVRLRQNRIHAKDCQECVNVTEGYVHRIERSVTFEGNLATNNTRDFRKSRTSVRSTKH